MPILVTNKDEVKISTRDQQTLRELEIDTINGIQDNGSSAWQTRRNLEEAFRLGFTARGRGEAEGQDHPPLPASMTEEAIQNENRFFLPVGRLVSWISQSRGTALKKVGQIVDVIPPGEVPDELKWPALYRDGRLLGSRRKKISYIVKVAPPAGSSAAPKFYWPRTEGLNEVTGVPLSAPASSTTEV